MHIYIYKEMNKYKTNEITTIIAKHIKCKHTYNT